MLEELSKKDSKWRSYALYLTKDKSTADDLVQDMYLRLHDYGKQINDFFVIITIRNMFYDQQKKIKTEFNYNDLTFFEQEEYNDLTDNEEEIINYIKNNCKWWELELLEASTDNSLRKMQDKYKIHYHTIYKNIKKIKDKVKNKYNG